jgi:hypothetical protein
MRTVLIRGLLVLVLLVVMFGTVACGNGKY